MNLRSLLEDSFSLDLRALAFFRIGIGGLLLYDFILRTEYLVLHYTDSGVLPVSLVKQELWESGFWSLHALSGSVELQVILFAIQGLAALSLLAGYKTSFSTILCWLLLLSLQNRNPWILNSGDMYLRLLLFWSIFLPLGQRYSIDSRAGEAGKKVYASSASFCFIIQILLLYVMTGLLKNSHEWLSEGSAIYYALNVDQMVKPLGKSLLQYPDLLTFMTHSVIVLEVIIPFSLIIPAKNHLFRTLGIVSLMLFHIGLWLTMELGIFVPVCLIALVALLTTKIINQLLNFVNQLNFIKADPGTSTNKVVSFTGNRMNGLLFPKTITAAQLALIGFIFCWNLNTLKPDKDRIPSLLKTAAHTLRIDQTWDMFAPTVLKDDGWFVIKADLENGKNIDFFQNDDVQWVQPDDLLSYYISERWRKYFKNLYRTDEAKFYQAFVSSFKWKWKQKEDAYIQKVT